MKVKTVVDALEVKSGSAPLGQATAIFSRFNVIDKDGDVTLPGAIPDGIEVPLSSYNHQSSAGGALPVGKAFIRTDHEKATAHIQFNMLTQAGRDHFEVIRDLGPIGEWSYALRILDSEHGNWQGQRVQFLKSLEIYEISPVLKGAGIRTQTTEAKEEQIRQYLRAVRDRWCPEPTPAMAREAEAHALAMQLRLRYERSRFDRSRLVVS
jgi:hypothetical protein